MIWDYFFLVVKISSEESALTFPVTIRQNHERGHENQAGALQKPCCPTATRPPKIHVKEVTGYITPLHFSSLICKMKTMIVPTLYSCYEKHIN